MSDFLQILYEITGTTSQAEIARKLDIPPTSLSNWISRGVSKAGALKIAKTYGVNVDYVLTGKGEMTANNGISVGGNHGTQVGQSLHSNISTDFEQVSDWGNETPLDGDEIEVPFYRDFGVACGHGTDGTAYENERRRLRMSRATIDRIGSHRDKIFATLAEGDSMSPTINDGDTIWVDMSKESIKDGKIFVFEYGGLFMCKRLYRLPNNGLKVVSDNEIDYPTFEITGEEREQNGFRLIGWVWHWSVMERW